MTEPVAQPVPLRRNRDFILLQVGQTLATVATFAPGVLLFLAVVATASPSISKAPSLAELDDLPIREAAASPGAAG